MAKPPYRYSTLLILFEGVVFGASRAVCCTVPVAHGASRLSMFNVHEKQDRDENHRMGFCTAQLARQINLAFCLAQVGRAHRHHLNSASHIWSPRVLFEKRATSSDIELHQQVSSSYSLTRLQIQCCKGGSAEARQPIYILSMPQSRARVH